MLRRAALLSLAMIRLVAPVHADGDSALLVVPLPLEWKDAARIRLVLEGLTVPGNRPLKLRVTTATADQREVFLGSAGIEALGPRESGARRVPDFRLDITRALKRFLENRRSAPTLELRIQPVDGRNNPLPDVKVSIGTVRLETRPE